MHAPVSSGALAFLRVSPKKRRGHHSRDRTWNEVAKAMVKMEAERETIKTRLLYNEKEWTEKGEKMAAISSLLACSSIS